MRICFVSHGSGRGGAEEVLLETIECLKDRNIECAVLMPGDRGLGADLKALGITYYKLPYWLWMGHDKSIWARAETALRNILLTVPAVLKVRKWKPDLIYSNSMTVGFGALLARVLRRPHIWHLHELGYEDHGLAFDFGAKFSYKVINSASACIAVSNITRDVFAKHIDPSKLTVIHNSVHRQAHWPENNSGQIRRELLRPTKHALRCVIVGRLSEGKRQKDAVEAIAVLKEMGIDVELVIVGRSNPGYHEELRASIRKLKLENQVCITGSVESPLTIVQTADIVLMCSRCEAFGRVTIEGMLAGKPVVAANSGANPELIQEGFNGLTYKVGDVRDLAAKIRYLYENPDVARRIGQNAKSWAQGTFSKDRYSNEIMAVLESVLDRP